MRKTAPRVPHKKSTDGGGSIGAKFGQEGGHKGAKGGNAPNSVFCCLTPWEEPARSLDYGDACNHLGYKHQPIKSKKTGDEGRAI